MHIIIWAWYNTHAHADDYNTRILYYTQRLGHTCCSGSRDETGETSLYIIDYDIMLYHKRHRRERTDGRDYGRKERGACVGCRRFMCRADRPDETRTNKTVSSGFHCFSCLLLSNFITRTTRDFAHTICTIVFAYRQNNNIRPPSCHRLAFMRMSRYTLRACTRDVEN